MVVDEQMSFRGATPCYPLRALLRRLLGESENLGFRGRAGCRRLRHFILKRNRQLSCATNSMLGNFP